MTNEIVLSVTGTVTDGSEPEALGDIHTDREIGAGPLLDTPEEGGMSTRTERRFLSRLLETPAAIDVLPLTTEASNTSTLLLGTPGASNHSRVSVWIVGESSVQRKLSITMYWISTMTARCCRCVEYVDGFFASEGKRNPISSLPTGLTGAPWGTLSAFQRARPCFLAHRKPVSITPCVRASFHITSTEI